MTDPLRQRLIPPLQQKVRERGLWACHLGPNLGGPGYGQVKLALLNEILGRTHCGPIVFGCQAPDSGNAEILAHYGNARAEEALSRTAAAQRDRLRFSMTEPHGGSDPTGFVTTAVLDGDEWVINGEKWFSSHARFAAFLIVLAVTDPRRSRRTGACRCSSCPPTRPASRSSATSACTGTPSDGTHAYIRYNDVRVPADHLLGERGDGFVVAQTRLGGGRIHHAMRTVGLVRKAFDVMCERALSRRTKGEMLARKQLVQEMIADSWIQLEQFRLLVLRTAWKIDRYNDYRKVRADISAVKAAMPQVLHDVAARALQIHGSLGVSNEMPFGAMVMESFHMGLADGATEVHKVTLARELLKGYKPASGLFPDTHLPRLAAEARSRYHDVLAELHSEEV